MTNLTSALTNLSRQRKKLIACTVDFFSILLAVLLAFLSSGISLQEINVSQIFSLASIPFLSVLIFKVSGIYHSVLRYIDFSFIYLLIRAILFSIIISLLVNFIFFYLYDNYFDRDFNFEDTVSFLGWSVGILSSVVLLIGTRLFAYYLFRSPYAYSKVVIYGAGAAGIQLASALRVSREMQPVAFLDSNKSLQGSYLGGIKVLNPKKLERLALKGKVDEVLIAMPSAPKSNLRKLLKEIERHSVKVRILPGLSELAQGKILVSELKEVDISDLLGRYEVEANQTLINKNIQHKVVLITGAGGSIGSEISRQVAKNKASKIILLDSNEYALYSIKKEIDDYDIQTQLFAVLASVTNKKRMSEVCETFKVDTIYHAAAYKHVPIVEENQFEAVFNNIQGTKVCVEAAIESKVETFVLISTDKAVRPTNIMGATKRFSEMILQSLAPNSSTRMTMVRFGNVLGSSGSAIPLFQQQIKEGGPVTVTHPEVIRYFMSIPEAAELVIQAGALGKGGDVFVLDMGEPVKIYDLAKRLINLSGMEVKNDNNPDGDIEIVFTGLRPGEKLYEELLIGNNVSATEHKQILRAEEDFLPVQELDSYLHSIKEAEKDSDVVLLREILQKVISGFSPAKEIVDVVYTEKK